MILCDACIAISNYVNLLDNTEIKHATNLLRLFRYLAKEEHDDDMEDAWTFLLYHTFLLFLTESKKPNAFTEAETNHALERLEHLAPETEQYRNKILKLLEKDLNEITTQS